MKKILLASAMLALIGASASITVLAQPPAGEPQSGGPPGLPGEPGPGRPDRGGPPRPPHPVMDALDKDGDHEISAEEINAAVASLQSLDKNSDGKLSDDEIRPPRPDVPPGPGPGRGDRDDFAPPGGFGGPGGPPRDGEPRGPQGRGRDRGDGRGPGRGPGGEPGPGPGGPGGPGRDDQRPDGPGRDGQGPDGPQRRGPMGPPNPERFVEDALRFDSDSDGKLDKAELLKFAEEMGSRQGRPPEGSPGGPGPEGRGPGDGGPRGRGPGGRDGNPDGERPPRPDSE